MSTATIGINRELDAALRKAFSDARVRIAPNAKLADIKAALEAMGLTVAVEDGFLVLTQGTTAMHTNIALKNFANRPENAQYFVLETSHPSTWTQQKKIEFLRNHTPDEYAQLLRGPKTPGIGVLSLDLTRAEYLSLTTQERVAFVREYGPQGVATVMARK